MTHERRRDTPCLHVCPLSGVTGIAEGLGQFDLLTLLSPDQARDDGHIRGSERHLELSFHDIAGQGHHAGDTRLRPGRT